MFLPPIVVNFREVFSEVGHSEWQKHVEDNAVYIIQ